MPDLSSFADLVPLDHGLCVMSTLQADGSIQFTVVNAGVMPDPRTGDQCVALVAAGGRRKLVHLRSDRRCTIVVRAGGSVCPACFASRAGKLIVDDDF